MKKHKPPWKYQWQCKDQFKICTKIQCYIGSLLCMKKVVFGENNPDEFKPAMISGSDLINDVNSAPTGPGWLSLYCKTMIMDDYIIIMCETITCPHHNHEQIVWIYCNYM